MDQPLKGDSMKNNDFADILQSEATYGYSSSTTTNEKTIFDVHLATLQLIENQLERLHNALKYSDGNNEITQVQITQLQNELCRLSVEFSKAALQCNTNGKQ